VSNRPKRSRRRAPSGAPGGEAALAFGRIIDPVDGATGSVPVARGVKLWYRVVGDGPETIIVPVTGNDTEFERLRVPGHRVLFYDVRRRGRSDLVEDPLKLGFAVEVIDLEAIRQSFGIDRFSAVAASYHAGIVATYAIQHPERVVRMVLAAPIPVRAGTTSQPGPEAPPHLVAELDQIEATGLRERDPAAFCQAWRKVYVPLLMGDPSRFDELAPVCRYPNEWPWQVAKSMVFVYAQLRQYDWRAPLRHVSVPTLLVHGSADQHPVQVVHEWTDALPDARLLELDGAGRFPWVERADPFFDATNRFLAGESV
jgi:proline iminopeptidase